MNREWAIMILNSVELDTLEHDCSLAKEAYRYLAKLKSTDDLLINRIYKSKYKNK